jgi:hypothetical protein
MSVKNARNARWTARAAGFLAIALLAAGSGACTRRISVPCCAGCARSPRVADPLEADAIAMTISTCWRRGTSWRAPGALTSFAASQQAFRQLRGDALE